jgi:molybdopterin synthase catalytic subunit
MILLTPDPIDVTPLLADAQRPEAGAVLLFLGTTRRFTSDRETLELHYEAYEEMASRELSNLEAEARRRWSLAACSVVHRLGRVPLAEASVAVVVSSSHRDNAFAAGRWLIDTLKETVPIWKQEHWADGAVEWVHPAGASAEQRADQALDKSSTILRATSE